MWQLADFADEISCFGAEKEKVEGEELQKWLSMVVAPEELAVFVKGKQELLLPAQASSS